MHNLELASLFSRHVSWSEKLRSVNRAGEIDLKVGAMEQWKVFSATMVGRDEKFLNSRRSRMAKTVIFWPWWQPFNSFCFETLSFFASVSLFSFCYAKEWGAHGSLRSPPVSPALLTYANLNNSSVFPSVSM